MNDKITESHTDSRIVIAAGPFKGEYRVHPTAELFPSVSKQRMDELIESIRSDGQQEPVVVDGDVLLDGRHRITALNTLQRSVKVVQFKDLGSDLCAADWIIAKNLHRRHLSDDQILAIASKHLKAKRPEHDSVSYESGVNSTTDASTKTEKVAPSRSTTSGSQAEQEFPPKSAEKQARAPRGRPPGGKRRDAEKLAKTTKQSRYRAENMQKLEDAAPHLAASVRDGSMTLKAALKQSGISSSKPDSDPGKKGDVDAAADQARASLRDIAKRLDAADRPQFWQRVLRIVQEQTTPAVQAHAGADRTSRCNDPEHPAACV